MRRATQLACALALMAAIAASGAAAASATCSAPPPDVAAPHDYSPVLGVPIGEGHPASGLPGFTRSAYRRDYGLVTPESRVWNSQPGWSKSVTSHLISRGSGAHFAMYLARLSAGGAAQPAKAVGTERFLMVLDGAVTVSDGAESVQLSANHFAYLPPNSSHVVSSEDGAGLVVYERQYALSGSPTFRHGYVEDSPLLPAPPEVFRLRKLLPATEEYDFNMHVMDFSPGEYLVVKEVHYNQHGLLLLEGQGIYRLADDWYPVQAGDAIWMAPYVTQWYAALGNKPSRYLLYKDTTVDPLAL